MSYPPNQTTVERIAEQIWLRQAGLLPGPGTCVAAAYDLFVLSRLNRHCDFVWTLNDQGELVASWALSESPETRVFFSRAEGAPNHELNLPNAHRDAVLIRHPSDKRRYTVVDLGCRLGCQTINGKPFRRADFTAPFAFVCDTTTIVVGRPDAADLPRLLTRPQFPETTDVIGGTRQWSVSFSRHDFSSQHVSRPYDASSLVPRFMQLDELTRGAETLARSEPYVSGDTEIGAMASVSSLQQTHALSSEALFDGLCVGRSEHCPLPGDEWLDGTVSRKHVLLIELSSALYIVDISGRGTTYTESGGTVEVELITAPQGFRLGAELVLKVHCTTLADASANREPKEQP